MTNSRTGKVECVFVNLEAVYPTPEIEMSFEELRAQARGWLGKDWSAENKSRQEEQGHRPTVGSHTEDVKDMALAIQFQQDLMLVQVQEASLQIKEIKEGSREGRNNRLKRTKIREIQAEPQTSK